MSRKTSAIQLPASQFSGAMLQGNCLEYQTHGCTRWWCLHVCAFLSNLSRQESRELRPATRTSGYHRRFWGEGDARSGGMFQALRKSIAHAFFCACAALLMTGCTHVISLQGLKQLSSATGLPDYRQANSKDVIGESDVFELSVKDGTNAKCQIQIAERCTRTDGSCPYPDDQYLTAPAQRLRITAFALATSENVQIKFPTQTLTACKATALTATLPTAGLVGRDWGAIKSALESKFTEPGLTLMVSRTKRYGQWMFPGDEVRISAEYMVGGGSVGAQPYTFTNDVSTVQRDGSLYITPLFYPAAPVPNPSKYYKDIGRAFGQQAASARVRIPVWLEGVGYAGQPTVGQVERCLASTWGSATDDWKQMPRTLVKERDFCRLLGIDSLTFGGDTDNALVRYRLEVQQTWGAVLWDGRRLQSVFVPGQTVADGVRRALRQATGRDVLPDWPVYVTVDPRPEFDEYPFYASLNSDAVLDTVLIAPGDVIHVSNYRPGVRRTK